MQPPQLRTDSNPSDGVTRHGVREGYLAIFCLLIGALIGGIATASGLLWLKILLSP